MTQNPEKPVVFLAFANAKEEGYLSQLKKESALLYDLFSPLNRSGQLEILREESLEHGELAKRLSQYKERLTVLHYGGHANSQSLSFEDGPGNVEGIAMMLKLQTNLKLVFLNGCSTQEQAKPFLEAGVPVVIATTRSVSDKDATFFAEHFYHALINEHGLREAFIVASGALKARTSEKLSAPEVVTFRGIGKREPKLPEMPWRMYVQSDNERALLWKLTKAKPKTTIKQRIWQWFLTTGAIVALLAGLAEFTGYSLKDVLSGRNVESFSVTVMVHGKEGKDDRILRNQGKVVIHIGTDIREATINEKGEATFKQIPIGFLNQLALITIDHPQPYSPTERDIEYQLEDGKAIYLETELTGLNRITGLILDFDTERPLDSVRVSYDGNVAFTNEFGEFELEISERSRDKFIKVNFYKKGYKIEQLDSIAPHLKQPIGLSLKKE